MPAPLRTTLFGYGYWGRNLARNLMAHPEMELVRIVDPDPQQRTRAQALYPQAHVVDDPESTIELEDYEVAVLATPLPTHFELSAAALASGKHLLVAKPLARTAAEVEQLMNLSIEKDRVLLVDHTFVYTGAVRKIRDLIGKGELGELVYCSSMRVNLGTYRRDSSVIWDLGPHDLSILNGIGCGLPSYVAATAGGRMGGPVDQIAHISLSYANGFLAHINLSWLAPVKMRIMLFGGSDKMLVYDDLEPSEKVKIYERGIQFGPPEGSKESIPIEYRLGDMWAPQLDQTEALYEELSHLSRCIRDREKPTTGAEQALQSVLVLEAAARSAQEGGAPLRIDSQAD